MTSNFLQPAKRCSLLRRRLGTTFQQFSEHWAGPHAAIALKMPGISRYTQNRVSEVLWQTGDSFACDGVVELEFTDAGAMAKAGEGDAVRTLLPQDEERFLDAITLCRVPGGAPQIRPGMSKVILTGCFSERGDVSSLRDLLQSSGTRSSTVDLVLETFHRSRLGFEADAPQVFATGWFDNVAAMRTAFSESSIWLHEAPPLFRRATAWNIDPLKIVG